jgi:hypothetical protein
MPPSSVALTERSWIERFCATRGDAGCEAGRQADEHVLDRRRTLVLDAKHFGMIGVVAEFRLVRLLGAEPKKLCTVEWLWRAVDPGARGAPLELCGLRCIRERLAGAEQRLHVDAVIDLGCSHFGCGHVHCVAPSGWSNEEPVDDRPGTQRSAVDV